MRLIHWVILFAIGLVILILCMWIFGIRMEEITGWVLLGTMVVIILYTIETDRMRKEMIRQTELSIKPLIAVHSESRFAEEIGTNLIKLFIKNVGYGVAKNVQIDKLEVKEVTDKGEDITIVFAFPTISAIIVGEKLEINKMAMPRGEFPPHPLQYMGYHFRAQAHILNITYEDLIEREHLSKVQCSKEGCRILEIK